MGFIDEKTRGRKSRATVPLRANSPKFSKSSLIILGKISVVVRENSLLEEILKFLVRVSVSEEPSARITGAIKLKSCNIDGLQNIDCSRFLCQILI
jgi:hypothetical protein